MKVVRSRRDEEHALGGDPRRQLLVDAFEHLAHRETSSESTQPQYDARCTTRRLVAIFSDEGRAPSVEQAFELALASFPE